LDISMKATSHSPSYTLSNRNHAPEAKEDRRANIIDLSKKFPIDLSNQHRNHSKAGF